MVLWGRERCGVFAACCCCACVIRVFAAFLGRRQVNYVIVDPEFEQRVQGNELRKNNVKC